MTNNKCEDINMVSKKTSLIIEKQVIDILKHDREYIRNILINLIERIEYLECKEFYNGIKEDVLKSISKTQ